MSTYNYSDELKKEPSKITSFLWWCAGADEYFLRKSPKQDRVKYAGIGGIVFFTGILAAFAGGIAVETMFGPKILDGEVEQKMSFIEENFWIIGASFGIVWGLLIFNLDRFIVSSTGKGDGTDKITWPEFKQAIPRILIALILGFSISKPLEILMLKSEIDVALGIKQQQKLSEFDKLTRAKYKEQIFIIDNDIDKIETERNVLVERQKQSEKEYIDQMQGRSGQQGFGPRAKQLKELSKGWENKIIEFDKKNNYQLNSLKIKRAEKFKKQDYELNHTNKENVKKLDGLLARIDISHEIGFWLGIAITLILLSIEMGPIFFKMMMTKGAYDYMVENNNHRMNMENGIFKEDVIYEAKNGIIHMEKYRYLEVESTRLEKERKIAEQNKINEELISQWGKLKIEAVKKDPTKFITEGDESIKSNNA
jgi:hypothetical protein